MPKRKININTASKEELMSLRMMGDTRAEYLVENRPYRNWDDVKEKVPSFSDQMIDDLKKSGATLD
ncbi:MAG TPA: helix-hairpin-helix domain-containing protein [Chitinispirillaceae bacterium]|jgi:DNA uptake protein ComE-like DNA-binding protein|nr:helix-hairpin-helix domain-containing protein [Chitinispirillaceae bacterium]